MNTRLSNTTIETLKKKLNDIKNINSLNLELFNKEERNIIEKKRKELREEFITKISILEEEEKRILIERYIECLTMKEIADKEYYSIRHTKFKLNQAIRKISH